MKYAILGFFVGFTLGVAAESWLQDWEPEEEKRPIDAKV